MRYVVAGAVLLVVAVSGCSRSEVPPAEVGPLASGSASASPATTSVPEISVTATATSAAPGGGSVPAEAQAPDSTGASAFARHYIETMNQALATSEVADLQALSDSGCGGCSNILTAIAQAKDAGHYVRGATLRVEFAEAPAVQGGETVVDVRYERTAGEVVDATDELVESIPAEGPVDTQLRLRHSKGAWSVLGFRQAPP